MTLVDEIKAHATQIIVVVVVVVVAAVAYVNRSRIATWFKERVGGY
jgi:hypothetical protein